MKAFNQRLKPRYLLPLGLAFLCGLGESSYAGEMGSLAQTELSSPWEFQVGPRYWYSTGRYQENLYGLTPQSPLNSRLIYSDITGQAAEGFWQLNHMSGLFIKGYVGGGAIISGHLNDEDFYPFPPYYSNTFHTQKDGNINYFSVDLGYQWGSEFDWQVGTFIGYHYWSERVNTFGGYQLVKSSQGNFLSNRVNVISNAANLSSLRIGINGKFHFSDTFSLSSDLAYIHSHLSTLDYHNLRPDIRGTFVEGQGNGLQFEAALNWHPSQALSMGVGYRLWTVQTKGFSHFEQTAIVPNAGPQRVRVNWDRYGLFLQTKYRFIDTVSSKLMQTENLEPVFDWRGFYTGFNVGYGTNPRTIYLSNVEPNVLTYRLPHNFYVQDSGFLGGGQIGYNYQLDQFLLGLEADLDYASLGGANTVRTTIPALFDDLEFNTSVKKHVGTLSTLRARVGKLATDNMLIYLTGGPAVGKVRLDLEQELLNKGYIESARYRGSVIGNKLGWTLGTGVEFAVDSAITLKAEYLYTALGKVSLDMPPSNGYTATTKFNHNVVRMGINYKF